MNLSTQSALAERVENFRLVIVLAFVLIGLNNAMEAIGYHYPPRGFLWAKTGFVVMDIAVLVSSLLVLVGSIRLRNVTPHLWTMLREEFVQKINTTALAASWIFTIFAVQAIAEWTEPDVLLFGTMM